MFCIHCGSQVPEYAKFCPSCGGALSEDAANRKIFDSAEWSTVENGLEKSQEESVSSLNHIILRWNESVKDWVDKWNDVSEEFIVDYSICDTNYRKHYLMMNQVKRIGGVDNVGFKGNYYVHDSILNGDTCNSYTAVVSKELGSNWNFLFEAEFEPSHIIGKRPGNLFSLRYEKSLDNDYYPLIQLSRWFNMDIVDRGIFKKTRYYMNFRPDWSVQFRTSEKWRKEHGSEMGNVILSMKEWMSMFGSFFWKDVDRYQTELTSFLGMDVYSFFEAYKYR
jgi:hypothetical protein